LVDNPVNWVLRSKHPLYDWSKGEFEEQVERFKREIKSFDFNIVVALTIYNEEEFIEDALNNCIIINDLNGIHIADGAWEGGGEEPNSTDNTEKIVKEWANNHKDIDVTWYANPEGKVWASEGTKRNAQLKNIEEIYGKAYVVVLDGDETISFNCGRNNIWLKRKIYKEFPKVGIINSYAYDSTIPMIGVRLIPTMQGVHYHTDRARTVHDKKCDMICDYNIEGHLVIQRATFEMPELFYVNHWNIRDYQRQISKKAYVEQVFDNDRKVSECAGV